MTAHAGAFPGSINKITVDTFFTKGGNAKHTVKNPRGNKEWDLSGGWHRVRPEGWQKSVKKNRDTGKREKRTLIGLDNKKYTVYYYNEVDEYGRKKDLFDSRIYFHAHGEDNTICQSILARANEAFSQEIPDNCKATDDGHIVKIEYAQTELLLRVTFKDGTICLFDKVPPTVAGTLIHAAGHRRFGYNKNSEHNHMLGILFWDYIRIRGSRYGAQYPWEYEGHAKRHLTTNNGRFKHAITKKELITLFPDMAKKFLFNDSRPYDDDEVFEVVLNEQENKLLMEQVARYADTKNLDAQTADELSHFKKAGENGKLTTYDERDNPEYQFFANEEKKESSSSSMLSTVEEPAKLTYRSDLITKGQTMLADFLNKEEVAKDLAMRINNGLQYNVAIKQLLNKYGEKDLAEIVDLRTGHIKENGYSDRTIAKLAKVVYGPRAYRNWLAENTIEGRLFGKVSRLWTVEDLKNMANPSLPNSIELRDSTAYKNYLKREDWEGALRFLKDHKTTWYYEDENGNKCVAGQAPYAREIDKLSLS